jgi:CubicO group peptidase (beta-lactamase class C family)
VIIERVTGTSYYDAVAKYVFEPAGMQHSSFPRHDESVGALGYTHWYGKPLRSNRDLILYRGVAAGCAWSSTRDLLAFANALKAGKLLDAHHTRLILNPMVRTRFGSRYGYGTGEAIIDGVRCIGHNGGFPGASASLLACDNGYTIAVAANFDPPVADSVAHFTLQRLPAQ